MEADGDTGEIDCLNPQLWLLPSPPKKPKKLQKALRVIALIATRFLWLHGVCIEQQLICKHSPTSLTAS